MSLPFTLPKTPQTEPLCPHIPSRFPLTHALLQSYQAMLSDVESRVREDQEEEVERKLNAVFGNDDDFFYGSCSSGGEEEDGSYYDNPGKDKKKEKSRALLKQLTDSHRTIRNVHFLLQNLHSPPPSSASISTSTSTNPITVASTTPSNFLTTEISPAQKTISNSSCTESCCCSDRDRLLDRDREYGSTTPSTVPSSYVSSSYANSSFDKERYEDSDSSSQPPSPAPTPNAFIPLEQDTLVGEYADLNANLVDYKLRAFRERENEEEKKREKERGYQLVPMILNVPTLCSSSSDSIKTLVSKVSPFSKSEKENNKTSENELEGGGGDVDVEELEEETPMQTRRASPVPIVSSNSSPFGFPISIPIEVTIPEPPPPEKGGPPPNSLAALIAARKKKREAEDKARNGKKDWWNFGAQPEMTSHGDGEGENVDGDLWEERMALSLDGY